MIAKMIAHGHTRDDALNRLAAALERTIVAGPRTNVGLLAALCRAGAFRAGDFDTDFIDRHLDELVAVSRGPDRAAAAAGARQLLRRTQALIEARQRAYSEETTSPWNLDDAFQLAGARRISLPILVDGEPMAAEVSFADGPSVDIDGVAPLGSARLIDFANAVYVLHKGRQTVVRLRDFESIDVEHLDTGGLVNAPMHGKLLAVLVAPGMHVVKGQRVALLEAMKMEHALTAPIDGVVSAVVVEAGSQVPEGARIMVIEAGEGGRV
jgi:3-methylcrotonyl-CoA carboxylase alpha subunit